MQKTGYCFIRLVINKFITSFYTWRNRVRSYGRNERLELYVEKSTRTVLRGGNGGNAISLTRRFRRGRKFGTILVDLTTHAIIDLLPDRNAETAAAWMRLHPEIEVVSRDRGEDYASAARLGAPQARQVADRFHLAKNLTEIVEEILARCRAEIRKASKGTNPSSEQQAEDQEPTASFDPRPSAPDPLAGSAHLAHYEERSDRYQQLLELRKEGLTSKEIARRLGMAERTIRRWITRGIPYEKAELRRKRRNRFDAYLPYLTERWNQGSGMASASFGNCKRKDTKAVLARCIDS